MKVLALDTATHTVVVGLVIVSDAGVETVAERAAVSPVGHAETLTPAILSCLAESGWARAELDAVVVGCGPGPFTGLRVGMATGAAFADALGIAAYPAVTLDAIAQRARTAGEVSDDFVVLTDARRKEIYWRRYQSGVPVTAPQVDRRDAVQESWGDAQVVADLAPDAASLVRVAALGAPPRPLVPLYLRRPDAQARFDEQGRELR